MWTDRTLPGASNLPCLEPSDSLDGTALASGSLVLLPTAAQASVAAAAARGDHDRVVDSIRALADALVAHERVSARECAANATRLVLREGGFGSTLSSLIKPRLHALLHGRVPLGAQPALNLVGSRSSQWRHRPLPPVPLHLFSNTSACAPASLECFLRPLAQCPHRLRANATAPGLGGRWGETASHAAVLQSAPPEFAHLAAAARDAGTLPTTALILASMLRPSAAVRAALNRVRRDLRWPRGGAHAVRLRHNTSSDDHVARPLLIGMHIRGGDACTADARSRHNRSCSPLAAYLPAVREMRRAYVGPAVDAAPPAVHIERSPPVYVYVSTDDEGAAAEVRALARGGGGGGRGEGGVARGGSEGFRWLLRSDVRRVWPRRSGQIMQIEQAIGAALIDGHRDAVDVLIDLFLLAE